MNENENILQNIGIKTDEPITLMVQKLREILVQDRSGLGLIRLNIAYGMLTSMNQKQISFCRMATFLIAWVMLCH